MSDLAKCPKCGMLMCACDVDHIPSCGCNGCEIARLRSEVAHLTFNRDHHAAANKALHDELKHLRAALRAQQLMQQGLGTLDTDNERMRAALQRIVAQDDIALAEEGYREGFANVVRIARKALAKSVTQGERSGDTANPPRDPRDGHAFWDPHNEGSCYSCGCGPDVHRATDHS